MHIFQYNNCSNIFYKKEVKKTYNNGPFALTGHMVQNPPHWMAKEYSRFEYKGIDPSPKWRQQI